LKTEKLDDLAEVFNQIMEARRARVKMPLSN